MKRTIKEIREQLHALQGMTEEMATFVDALRSDERAGVAKLVDQFEKEQTKAIALRAKYKEMTQFEQDTRNEGYTMIAGIDEAGRGPLAGPVVAAAVILPTDVYIPGLNDSKQLSAQKRASLYDIIQQQAIAIGVGVISAQTIDEVNIYEASKLAMLEAVQKLAVTPDHLLIDAMVLPTEIAQTKIIKGDARSVSIAAASVIAKVTRDHYMEKLHEQYPHYQFHKNMGYGTKDHLEALHTYGSISEHRQSFAPVRQGALV
ncbi:ribonuclease H [Fictibacillus macauensis ZFHKF-1]|uniref:Ribonuclease HII n=1 Tax=Fictibacillus macauensis ZFHKF-1 TaxID=1196324 RepID=I8AHA0_9BACL|nr:ribonuclease HII [Fictibacillus macauensis]EIT85067.1 ribonuclease H [Fictibacillus macauensis ZFHKF-1]